MKIVRVRVVISGTSFLVAEAQTALILANSEEEPWNSVDDVDRGDHVSPIMRCEEDETSVQDGRFFPTA